MNFKTYLMEAEWVNGQRRPTKEAAWEILKPLAGSTNHVVALGINEIHPQDRLVPGNWMYGQQGSRADKTHGGLHDPHARAAGIRAFMQRGLEVFGENPDVRSRYILHVMEIDPKQVWFLDPKVNQQNPWTTMNTHWRDMEYEAKQILAGNPKGYEAAQQWDVLKGQIETIYKNPVTNSPDGDSPEAALARLQTFFQLVYLKAPKLLHFMQRGWSYDNPGGGFMHTSKFPGGVTRHGPSAGDLKYPKFFEEEYGAIAPTSPLTDSAWVLIINPRIARKVNDIVLNHDFRGFKGTRDDKNAFYAPNSKNDAFEKFREDLDEPVRELIEDMESGLEKMDEIMRGYARHTGMSRVVARIERHVTAIRPILRRLKTLNPEFKPEKIADAAQQFLDQAWQIIRADYEHEEEEVLTQIPHDIVKIMAEHYKKMEELLGSISR